MIQIKLADIFLQERDIHHLQHADADADCTDDSQLQKDCESVQERAGTEYPTGFHRQHIHYL